PKTHILSRGPYPDVPSISLQNLSAQAEDPSRGDAAVRKWTGVTPSAVMQTYPLSPSCEGIPSLTSRGQIGFPTITTRRWWLFAEDDLPKKTVFHGRVANVVCQLLRRTALPANL